MIRPPVSARKPSLSQPAAGALRSALIVAVLVAGGGTWWWLHRTPAAPGTTEVTGKGGNPGDAAGKSGKGGKAGKGGTPSVVVARVKRRDFLVWQDSLGTITPLANVTVRTRVDGELLKLHVKEGQSVRKDAPLADIDPRAFQVALDQAQATLGRDVALLDNARIDLQRYQDLAKLDAIPHQQLDTQLSLVHQEEATVRNDQAAVDNARLNLSYCHITAPINGQVGLRLVDPGNMVHAADANGLITVAQMQPISVLFSLPQDLLPTLRQRLASHEKVRVEAYDRTGEQRLAGGVLASSDNQIDPTTGTLKLRARFPNDDAALYPNQFVNVRILMDVRKDVPVMPASAIQRGAQGPYVYVLKADRTVAVQMIRPGPADKAEISIESGLNGDEQVVIDGADKLRDGIEVSLADRPRGKGGPGGNGGQGLNGGQGVNGGLGGNGKGGPDASGAGRAAGAARDAR